MIKKLFCTIGGIGEKEFDLMLMTDAIRIVDGGSLGKIVLSNEKVLMSLTSDNLVFHEGMIKSVVDLFKSDIMDIASCELLGMELKRPCQYNREWINGFVKDALGGIIGVLSSSGVTYDLDKVKVYKDEDNTSSVYSFLSSTQIERLYV